MLNFKLLSSSSDEKLYNLLVINNHAYTSSLMSVLIDTGAYLPTWVDGIDAFIRRFPDSKFANAESISKGFGLEYEILPIYIVPEYRLTDEKNNTVCIRNLPVAVTEKDFSFSMILSFTTFRNMNFSYNSSVYKQSDKTRSVSILSNPILSISPRKQIYNSSTDFVNITDKVLELLESEYPDIENRLTQNKLLKKAVILAQN